MFIALGNPVLAIAGGVLLALVLFSLFRRLLKYALFLGILAAGAWIWFFAG